MNGDGGMFQLKNPPKDIQEGTLNHLMMIANQIERGNPAEAGYLVSDLIYQVSNRALVITMRVAPLDHEAQAKLLKEAHMQGYAKGLADGKEEAIKEYRRRISAVLV